MALKILQVTTVGTTINAFLLPFSKKFKQKGWQVDAAASQIMQFHEVLDAHDNCFEIEFCRNPLNLYKLYKSLGQIRRLLISEKYDIVHVHTPIAAFLTRLSTVGIKKTKIFYTAHGFHYIKTNPRWKNFIFYLVEKLAGYKTDHLFVINKDDYDFAVNNNIVSKNKITFINGIGVDIKNYQYDPHVKAVIREQLKLSQSSFILLHIAELNCNKNHMVILQALALLKQENPNADICYVIVGVGKLKENLQKRVKEFGLFSSVLFLGYRSDISALLSGCDVLTLSSKREGLPRCILEAMCVQKPIIASKIRGCTDLLSSGAGILVEYNDVSQWTKAIEQLYIKPETRKKMGERGYQLVERYYQEQKVVDSVLAIYEKEIFL